MSPLFLLRWSLRDLRRAWVQVAAVALVIAIGTGLFAALEGSSTWRRVSNDASFAATGMYDLRVRSTEGLDTAQGSMLAVLDSLDDPTVVARAEERLLVDTQVDASTADRTILVPGRIVGLDTSSGGPWLTSVVVPSGGGRPLWVVPLVVAVAALFLGLGFWLAWMHFVRDMASRQVSTTVVDEAATEAAFAEIEGRIGPVEAVSQVGYVDASVRRTDRIPEEETGGIAVQAADLALLERVHKSIRLSEYKRRQAPPILKISSKAFGPGRVYPITCRF